jgi:PmbA protein
MHSTGNSARELSGAPLVGPSNFYLKPGNQRPEEIIESVKDGLYVTELIGFGVNIVTGDFSQGAVGIWIENGKLAYPVEEITIAGNLKDMLTGIEAIGNDLLPVNEVFSPTFKISRMVISGN